MQFRKPKTPEVGRQRRITTAEPTRSPVAFSYYANRTPENRPGGSGPTARKKPLFGAAQRLRPRSIGQIPAWALMIIVLVCLVKLLVLTTNPKVVVVKTGSSVMYLQSTTVYQQAAQKFFSADFANRLKLTANLNGVSQQMKQEFPELQSVSAAVPFVGNRPILYLAPAAPAILLQTPSGAYAVDASGTVLARVPATASLQVVHVTDQTGVTPVVGKQVLPGSTLRFIATTQFQLQAAQLSIAGMTLPQGSTYELDVQIAGKPYVVRMSLQADARQQAGAAVATIKHLGSTQPASYLDVRAPERVYYK